MNINTALPLQARNQMLRGMDWWNFGGADASIAPTWFGLRYARLKVVLQRTVVSRFGCSVFEFSRIGCSVFEFWVLRFRDLGAPFSSFGCFVFEIWVLRASVFVFECFVFETTQGTVCYRFVRSERYVRIVTIRMLDRYGPY